MALDQEFLDLYRDLASEVEQAHYEFLPERLSRWFNLLDTTPGVAEITRRLETQGEVDYNPWQVNLQASRELPRPWHPEADRAMGIRFVLFRFFSTHSPEEISAFGFEHFGRSNDLDANAHAVIAQIFMPMTRDLRRYLDREATTGIPASDRVVKLDHNQTSYREVQASLEKLERAIRELNDYPDTDDREQRIAEVSAAQRLMKAPRIGERAVAFIKASLTYLGKRFADVSIGETIGTLLPLLAALIGSLWHLL
jgi:hypothetical protein